MAIFIKSLEQDNHNIRKGKSNNKAYPESRMSIIEGGYFYLTIFPNNEYTIC